MNAAFELPKEVITFFNNANNHVGEFCREAVLSNMMNASLSAAAMGTIEELVSFIGENAASIVLDGVLSDGLDHKPDANGSMELIASCFEAQVAIHKLVYEYRIESGYEAMGFDILGGTAFWCQLQKTKS